jgi:hypothetical protein
MSVSKKQAIWVCYVRAARIGSETFVDRRLAFLRGGGVCEKRVKRGGADHHTQHILPR